VNIRKIIRKSVQNAQGYTPGEQCIAGYLKLNANENFYPVPEKILEEVKANLFDSLALYPDSRSETVRDVAAQSYGLKRGNIMVGNGSSELLSLIYRTFIEEGDLVAMPSPGFTLNRSMVSIQGGRLVEVGWSDGYQLPVEALLAVKAKIIVITNPNNPTGTLCPINEIEALAQAHDGLLVLDEAYVDFAEDNGLKLLEGNENIIILRTFSKSYSVAGIRFGLAFSSKETIRNMLKVQNSYPVGKLTEVFATTILKKRALFDSTIEQIKLQREVTSKELSTRGFKCTPSQANFLFVKVPAGANGADWYEALKKEKILVRYFEGQGLDDCLRVTIGRSEEMKILVRSIDGCLQHFFKSDL